MFSVILIFPPSINFIGAQRPKALQHELWVVVFLGRTFNDNDEICRVFEELLHKMSK